MPLPSLAGTEPAETVDTLAAALSFADKHGFPLLLMPNLLARQVREGGEELDTFFTDSMAPFRQLVDNMVHDVVALIGVVTEALGQENPCQVTLIKPRPN